MTMRRVMAVLAGVTLATTAAAQTPAPATAGAPTAQTPATDSVGKTVTVTGKNNDPNRMVCRTVGATGSRLQKTKRCQTAAQWAAIQADERRDFERQQSQRWKSD